MTENNFSKRQHDAIEQMREMKSRSIDEVDKKESAAPMKSDTSSMFSLLNLPFLDKLKTDGDLTLIIGILLLLLSEKADKRLLFALVYILL